MDSITSLYFDGNAWILNGALCPSGIFILGQDEEYVYLLGTRTGARVSLDSLITDIDKNALGDKYLDGEDFRKGTKLFFEKKQSFDEFISLHGQTVGFSTVDKFGANPLITQGTDPEDVWEFGGLYPYDPDGTAPIAFVSSDDAADDQQISVLGQDVNGNELDQIVTLNGQNNVTLPTPLWRTYRLENVDSTEHQGTVYCHTDPSPTNGIPLDANVRNIMTPENQQSLMALYTIPKGKVGYLYRGELGIEAEGNTGTLAEYCRFVYKSRRYGKVFKTKKRITVMVAGGSYEDKRVFPDIIPALTDIRIQAQEVSLAMGAWAAFAILLVDEDKFPQPFLDALQPY